LALVIGILYFAPEVDLLADPIAVVGLVSLASLEDIGSACLVSNSSILSGFEQGILIFLVALLLLLEGLRLGGCLLGFGLDFGGH
jgi:hypothetical protein